MFAALSLAVTVLDLLLTSPAFADDTILRVSRAIAKPDRGKEWNCDLAAFSTLPTANFETTASWSTGPQSLDGVALITLLKNAGANRYAIYSSALNGYSVSIPERDMVKDHLNVAFAKTERRCRSLISDLRGSFSLLMIPTRTSQMNFAPEVSGNLVGSKSLQSKIARMLSYHPICRV